MQIDVTLPVIGYDGEPLEIPAQKPGDTVEPLTLRKALCDSLMGSFRDEEKISGSDKLKRFELARKLHKCEGPFELTGDDIKLCRDMVAKMYATVVAGAVWDMLSEESKAV